MRVLLVAAVVILVACDTSDTPPSPPPPPTVPAVAVEPGVVTPDALFGAGPPTFVVGTLGDDAADRSVMAQAEGIRSLFPGATIVTDTFDGTAGPAAWPARPVLFGGAHVNRIVAALGDTLPLTAGEDAITIGDARFVGVGYRVITAIPADERHPAFVLYAGTGMPGTVDINNVRHGGEPILIADAFGRLRAGRWVAGSEGLVAELEAPARRIGWRSVARSAAGVDMQVSFPEMLPPAEGEPAIVDAIARGVTRSVERLALAPPLALTVYVHPDRRSKLALTGDGGDGHAMAMARALHVLATDPGLDGPLERLVAHEATHALVGQAWGATSSALLGEGVAVWVSGSYGGTSLDAWAARLEARPAAATLLPMRAFRARPEGETYPFAGLLFEAAVSEVGLAAVRAHLYDAPSDDWDAACVRAGTTAARLDAAVVARR